MVKSENDLCQLGQTIQLCFNLGMDPADTIQEKVDKIEYIHSKGSKLSVKPSRNPLSGHLPRKEILTEPTEDKKGFEEDW